MSLRRLAKSFIFAGKSLTKEKSFIAPTPDQPDQPDPVSWRWGCYFLLTIPAFRSKMNQQRQHKLVVVQVTLGILQKNTQNWEFVKSWWTNPRKNGSTLNVLSGTQKRGSGFKVFSEHPKRGSSKKVLGLTQALG